MTYMFVSSKKNGLVDKLAYGLDRHGFSFVQLSPLFSQSLVISFFVHSLLPMQKTELSLSLHLLYSFFLLFLQREYLFLFFILYSLLHHYHSSCSITLFVLSVKNTRLFVLICF